MEMKDVLVLDSNWVPQSFCNWEDAVKLIYENRATVIKEDEAGRVLRSPSFEMGLPRVIVVKNLWKKRRRTFVPCTRRNLLVRDNATCQYCGVIVSTQEYTIDHVTPRCLGGTTVWNNIVCCCVSCNRKKAGLTLRQAKMKLLKEPTVPNATDPRFNFKLHIKKLRKEWEDWQEYLYSETAPYYYWNVALEEK